MKFFSVFKKALRATCLWYTVISLCLLVVGLIAGNGQSYLDATSFLLLFPFGLAMALAGMLYRSGKLRRWARWLLHYAITLCALLVFVLLPHMNGAVSPVTVLLLCVLLSILYWILFLLIHIFQKRFRKILEED